MGIRAHLVVVVKKDNRAPVANIHGVQYLRIRLNIPVARVKAENSHPYRTRGPPDRKLF
jgi:hypothetical protein